eukprot:819157_1
MENSIQFQSASESASKMELSLDIREIEDSTEDALSRSDSPITPFDPEAGPKAVEQTPWGDLSRSEQVKYVTSGLTKFMYGILVLYGFLIGLKLMSDGFKLIGARKSGELFSVIEGNPILGLMVGVFFTVTVQSSSTTTSVVVALVASEQLLAVDAVFVIMGANIGTSVTSSIVA